MSRTSHDLSDEEAQHIADEVNSLCHWPDKQTPPVFHWPSLTSRRKNEVVHQYVALSEDLLDVPDYLGDDHPALIALLDRIDPKWSYELGLVMVHDCEDGTIHVCTTGCRSCEEAMAICLLRAKGVVVET